ARRNGRGQKGIPSGTSDKVSSRVHKADRGQVPRESARLGIDFPVVGWLAHHEQVANLAEQASLVASAADVLGEIGAVHRATDPPLREEARAEGGHVAKKGVIEVAEAGGEVFLALGGQEESEIAAGPEG